MEDQQRRKKHLGCNKMRDEIYIKPATVCSAIAELFHYKWNALNAARLQTEPNWIEITVYPNPNDGNFYLKLEGIESAERQLVLYDLIGKEYMREQVIIVAETPLLIRLPDNIAEGIYILSFRNQLSNSYFKIIIDKP